MLLLLRTFVDIIALRKGPDSVPRSWLVVMFALVLMVISAYATVTVIGSETERNYGLTAMTYGLGILFYAAIIYLSGHPQRILQSVASIIACGSLITFLFVAEYALFKPLLGQQFAGLVATLILFWSVPVEGHIIARAIAQHWFVGIAIAMVAFVLQFGLQSALTEPR
ncbi:MAG: hypothetical protein U5K76_13345 [Woeseiaceae bacterium]|nr:hypothetical protein [Woeseiaceae bacterium]